MRPTIALAAGAIALAAVAGCAPTAPQVTPEPTPTAPTEPTTEPTTAPTTPTAPTPSASPSASPSPSASGDDDDARYCGDEYVLSVISGGPVGWEGTPEEQLEHAQPRGVFEPADAIDDLDAVCVVTYRMPTDGGSDVVAVVSQAVLERDDDVFDELEEWATANGYVSRSGGTGFGEREAPPNPDGSSTMKIFWAPLDGDDPVIGNAAEIVQLTGADPDAVLVVHSDFTQG